MATSTVKESHVDFKYEMTFIAEKDEERQAYDCQDTNFKWKDDFDDLHIVGLLVMMTITGVGKQKGLQPGHLKLHGA